MKAGTSLLSGLLLTCAMACGGSSTGSADSGGDDDPGTAWLAVNHSEPASVGTLFVGTDYSYIFLSETHRTEIRGQLDSGVGAELEQLLATELLQEYGAHAAQTEAESVRCHDEAGGFFIDLISPGCFIPEEVTDDRTRVMLDFVVTLYREKEAELVASLDQ